MPYLIISENFYSIQGEGPCAGFPAVFLRLTGCNLDCTGFGCDTRPIWKQGEKIGFGELIDSWRKNGWLEKLKQGAHLVITGGEPLLQQNELVEFVKSLQAKVQPKIYIEIETNATISFKPEFLKYISQINASPKLANSGNARENAFKSEVLKQLTSSAITRFKFVVSEENDIDEILQKYIAPFKINPWDVWLMPAGATRAEVNKKSPMIAELCKKHMMNFSPRLQINIWQGKSGV